MSCILGACILAAQLTQGGIYTENTPLYDVDSHNITHDISKFYEVDNIQFKLGGYVVLDTDTRINLNYDNGLESQKRSRGKALTVGITQLSVIDEDSHITYGFSTRLGGSTTDRPCRDKREVYKFKCDDLSNLDSFEKIKAKDKRNDKVFVNYTLKFNSFLGTKIK